MVEEGKNKCYLTSNVKELCKSDKELTIRHYIKNPFLIDSKKFIVWYFALVTSLQPLTVFLHNEGVAYFAKQKYNTTELAANEWEQSHITSNSKYVGNKHMQTYLSEVISDFKDMDFDTEKLHSWVTEIIQLSLISI